MLRNIPVFPGKCKLAYKGVRSSFEIGIPKFILPVSVFQLTMQAMSYILDVYHHGAIKADEKYF